MNCIDQFRHEVKSHLLNHPLIDLREEISSTQIECWRLEMAPQSRNRLWTIEWMLWFWIVAGVHRERSFRAVTLDWWAPVCSQIPGLADLRLNDGRMAEGRSRVPLKMIQAVREEFARLGIQEGEGLGTWRGRRVLWADGTTLSLQDEPGLWKHFGGCSNQHGSAPFPLVRLVMLGIAATRIVIGSAWGPVIQSEKQLILRALDALRIGDVVAMDLYFASIELFAELRRRGADALTKKRPQLKIQKHPHRKIGPNDWIVEMPLDPEASKRDAALPRSLEIRVVKVRLAKGHHLWLQTTLLDPVRHPAQELAQVYLQRWGAETSYAEIKADLHLRVVRSQSVDGVGKEIEAHLAAYNYVRLLMIRAAHRVGIDPRRLSFRTTLRLIIRFAQLRRDEADGSIHWDSLLRQIAAYINPDRPGRREPRALKRRLHSYQRWKGSRTAWRAAL